MAKRRRARSDDVAPTVRASFKGSVSMQIYNMRIDFEDGHAVMFSRGAVRRRLVTQTAGLRARHMPALKDILPLAPGKFEQALYDNLRVAARQLDASYDIVSESKSFVDIISMAAEQLEVIAGNDWRSPNKLREAVDETKTFLLERLVRLIKATNEKMHVASMDTITSKMLKDAIAAGRLQPTEDA